MSENLQRSFVERHIGPSEKEINEMLVAIGASSLDDLISRTVPSSISFNKDLDLGKFNPGMTEVDVLKHIRSIADKNKIFKSYIGCGYYGTITPAPILRNILENPGWYTQYTPYQAEISQGRLEALLNFQTLISDLTGLPVANASLLDEATAAAEAMALSFHLTTKDGVDKDQRYLFHVSEQCHPQTIAVVKTRAEAIDLDVEVCSEDKFSLQKGSIGLLIQYPNTRGEITDPRALIDRAHSIGAIVTMAADPLALSLLTPPGELGADIAIGSAQRFGVPMGFGGPHAAYFATKDEFKRLIPGRIIGVSKDSNGDPAMRLALQTREQHIRREKATSNICTAQVLLAIMASMYCVYHGPDGVRAIASGINDKAKKLAEALLRAGWNIESTSFFDTISIKVTKESKATVLNNATAKGINLRDLGDAISISLDEETSEVDLTGLISLFESKSKIEHALTGLGIPAILQRSSNFLTHPVFNSYHSESEFLRYIKRLEAKDLSLAISMIPLGSCTMKLNATTEMIPVTWKEFGGIHPFAPKEQGIGYREIFRDLSEMLKTVTGFDGVSLQPNAGSQGEYAGLLAIRGYLLASGQANRDICLIPKSAHGTNPASAIMAGFKVVVVACDADGNIDLSDLKVKIEENKDTLAALMVTYPSTHGVFESGIKQGCDLVHQAGGQVYMDGANLNALVGICRPVDIGADVCHINLHKTFCIPHGGGGPGMGPIAVRKHLAEFLPGHPLVSVEEGKSTQEPAAPTISAAPWGSASILVISWVYIALMGARGLKRATQIAILNANYISKRLQDSFPT